MNEGAVKNILQITLVNQGCDSGHCNKINTFADTQRNGV